MNTGDISFDVRNDTDMEAKDIVSNIERTVSDSYSVEESSYETVESNGTEYIHVNMTVNIDNEDDLDVINYVLMAVPTLTSGIDILNIEQDFIEQVEENWNDDATWDGEDIYVDDDEGLVDIDDPESDIDVEIDDIERFNDGLYLDDEEDEQLELQED